MSKIREAKFKIDGMHCVSCAMNIDFDLEDLDGIHSAKTSYAKCECQVKYDEEKINHNDVISQINKTGYKVKEVSI